MLNFMMVLHCLLQGVTTQGELHWRVAHGAHGAALQICHPAQIYASKCAHCLALPA